MQPTTGLAQPLLLHCDGASFHYLILGPGMISLFPIPRFTSFLESKDNRIFGNQQINKRLQGDTNQQDSSTYAGHGRLHLVTVI